jgi:hypothetical protein
MNHFKKRRIQSGSIKIKTLLIYPERAAKFQISCAGLHWKGAVNEYGGNGNRSRD